MARSRRRGETVLSSVNLRELIEFHKSLPIYVYVLQSHNQILRAAACGDVAALRCVAGETDCVLLSAIQNKVCHCVECYRAYCVL